MRCVLVVVLKPAWQLPEDGLGVALVAAGALPSGRVYVHLTVHGGGLDRGDPVVSWWLDVR